jgi:hypothetical protein
MLQENFLHKMEVNQVTGDFGVENHTEKLTNDMQEYQLLNHIPLYSTDHVSGAQNQCKCDTVTEQYASEEDVAKLPA